jgi:hypothetical protein
MRYYPRHNWKMKTQTRAKGVVPLANIVPKLSLARV